MTASAATGVGRQRSDALDHDSLCVRRKSLKVVRIGRQDGASGLCDCDDDGVNSRAASRAPPKQRCPTSETVGNVLHDIASLEELICGRVAPSVTLKALGQNHRRHHRRPKALLT